MKEDVLSSSWIAAPCVTPGLFLGAPGRAPACAGMARRGAAAPAGRRSHRLRWALGRLLAGGSPRRPRSIAAQRSPQHTANTKCKLDATAVGTGGKWWRSIVTTEPVTMWLGLERGNVEGFVLGACAVAAAQLQRRSQPPPPPPLADPRARPHRHCHWLPLQGARLPRPPA